MIPTAGEFFGPYEILGTLGRGGVGEVYRAWDGRLGREVALKVLHEDFPQNGNRERFLLEARAASALNHPNICTVFDMGDKDGAPYLVMELLKGETVKQRIDRGGIPSEEINQVGAEMAEALGAAHALGIVHRDIKPANVMLVRQPDGRCRAKVLDFGLAKLTGPLPGSLAHHDEHLTVVGEAVGTVSYMSPEQARGDELDGRSDLFSLGVVMYEMATRRTPFHGATPALLFVQLLNHDPEPIHDWNDSVPRALEKAILKLLEKDPSRRFQSTSEVIAALHSAAAKGSGSRWRRAAAPAVPLVRVEEPVARAGLPPRPDFRQDHGVISLGLNSPHGDTPTTPRGEGIGAELVRPGTGAHVVSPARVTFSRRDSSSLPDSWTPPHPESGPSPRTPTTRVILDTPVSTLKVAMKVAMEEPQSFSSVSPGESPSESRTNHPAGQGALAIVSARRVTAKLLRSPMVVRAAVAGIVLGILGGALASRLNQRPRALLSPTDTLLITDIENHTAVQSFDGSIAAGLDLALTESPELSIRGIAAYRAAVHSMGADARPDSPMQAHQAAQAAGAHAYVYGEIREGEEGAHSTGVGYTLSVAVLDTASSRELARAEAHAARTQEIPAAIDEVASVLRNQLLGEAPGTPPPPSVPLAREATGSLNALRAYAAGARAEGENHPEAALKAYGIATAADPNFVQALVHISWLSRELGSDTASAQAGSRAESASLGRTARTAELAEIAANTNAQGDLTAAHVTAARLVAEHPRDPEVLLTSARILRLQGQFAEALSAAQQGIKANKYDPELYREGELSLLALDHYAEAATLEASAAGMGLAHPDLAVTAAYLAGRKDWFATGAEALSASSDPAVLAIRAAFLDNTGQRAAAAAAWREAADSTRGQTGLIGAAAVFTARAALGRALAGDCPAAVALGRDAATRTATSPDSLYTAGMAGALCGDSTLAHAGLSGLAGSRTEPLQAPRLHAALLLSQGNAGAASAELAAIHSYDPSYLTSYLSGLAHLAAHDPASSARDFQQVLAHRGAALTGGADVYAAAQLGLSKAFAAAGNLAASQQAYSRFQQLWSGAGSAVRFAGEAKAAARPAVKGQGGLQQSALQQSGTTRENWGGAFSPAGDGRPRGGGGAGLRTQSVAGDATVLTAWPDRPTRLPAFPQDRKYQNVRGSDLE